MRLYAIDGNALAHWQWHAYAESGETTLADATRNWWSSFCRELNPTHAVVCFDGGNNWRKQVYAEYKASRLAKPVDEEKLAALKTVDAAWQDLGVPTLRYETFEADDTIASLCAVFADELCEVVVVSSDKDMMQLVGDSVLQYDPRPNKANECVFYDAAKVEEKLGVPPHRVQELLAIMGDSSDDVPGVDSWGKVAAVNAIRQTKSLAGILRKAGAGELEHITPKKQAALVDAASAGGSLMLSLGLVKLRVDVPVPSSMKTFRLSKQEAA